MHADQADPESHSGDEIKRLMWGMSNEQYLTGLS